MLQKDGILKQNEMHTNVFKFIHEIFSVHDFGSLR